MLEDVYLEYATCYIFYYNMILNLKDSGKLNSDTLENIKAQIETFTKSRDETVCKKHKITPLLLE